MKNKHTQQAETSAIHPKKRNGIKGWPMAGLVLGISAIAFAIFWLMFADVSSSRPSTPAEIAGQMKFQEKWNTAQKEAEQKWDSTLKAAEQKPGSLEK